MTTDDLKRAERAFQRAQDKADAARLERNALIHEALVQGWSQAQIARATGLSGNRVWQLTQTMGKRVFVAHEVSS